MTSASAPIFFNISYIAFVFEQLFQKLTSVLKYATEATIPLFAQHFLILTKFVYFFSRKLWLLVCVLGFECISFINFLKNTLEFTAVVFKFHNQSVIYAPKEEQNRRKHYSEKLHAFGCSTGVWNNRIISAFYVILSHIVRMHTRTCISVCT